MDGAGFNDSKLQNEAPNQASIQYIFNNALCFKIVIIINGGEVTNERGSEIVALLQFDFPFIPKIGLRENSEALQSKR